MRQNFKDTFKPTFSQPTFWTVLLPVKYTIQFFLVTALGKLLNDKREQTPCVFDLNQLTFEPLTFDLKGEK